MTPDKSIRRADGNATTLEQLGRRLTDLDLRLNELAYRLDELTVQLAALTALVERNSRETAALSSTLSRHLGTELPR